MTGDAAHPPDRTESTPSASECDLELAIIMPCLNEADTLASCIRKAYEALQGHRITAEIIVADNGSTDGSADIARRLGARVVQVADRGYGHALMGGIAATRARYVIMGDADDSYDFRDVPRLLAKLRGGYELVQGCRFPSGGGRVMPGAMRLLHYWGNPVLSRLARLWFRVPVHDVYCGLRGFTTSLYRRLDLRCAGMEFAAEMIIKASLRHEKIAEVPIVLYPDGRRSHRPHLKTVRDGWRTLRLFLTYSPRWLFLVPGSILVLLGLAGYGLAMPGVTVRGVNFDAHTLLFASLFVMLGYQCVLFSIFAKTFAIAEGLLPEDPRLTRFFEIIPLEAGLLVGAGASLIGVTLLLAAVNEWHLANFGALDYARTMRLVVPGVTLTTLGLQTVMASFLVSLLAMRRK